MITFCIGFFIGCAFDYALRYVIGRRIYLRHKDLIDDAVRRAFMEDLLDDDDD